MKNKKNILRTFHVGPFGLIFFSKFFLDLFCYVFKWKSYRNVYVLDIFKIVLNLNTQRWENNQFLNSIAFFKYAKGRKKIMNLQSVCVSFYSYALIAICSTSVIFRWMVQVPFSNHWLLRFVFLFKHQKNFSVIQLSNSLNMQ